MPNVKHRSLKKLRTVIGFTSTTAPLKNYLEIKKIVNATAYIEAHSNTIIILFLLYKKISQFFGRECILNYIDINFCLQKSKFYLKKDEFLTIPSPMSEMKTVW